MISRHMSVWILVLTAARLILASSPISAQSEVVELQFDPAVGPLWEPFAAMRGNACSPLFLFFCSGHVTFDLEYRYGSEFVHLISLHGTTPSKGGYPGANPASIAIRFSQ